MSGKANMRRVAALTLATCAGLMHSSPANAQSGPGFELARTSFTSVHQYVAAEAIPTQLTVPPNLEVSDMYRPRVEGMLRGSPTFRRQCLRISADPAVTVRLIIGSTAQRSGVRAQTRLRRNAGRLTATVEISPFQDLEELIAHEIEHVIEQLDGVDLEARAARSHTGVSVVGPREDMFETVRAHRAGLTVVSELRR